MVGVGPAVNTNYRSPLVWGGKVQFTCSYSLYPAVLTHLRSWCKAWLALRLNGNPPCIRIPQCKGDTGKQTSLLWLSIIGMPPQKLITCRCCALSHTPSCESVGGGRLWVVIWYLTRPPEAGWSSRLFTALGGGANYRRGAGVTPLNSDYSHFVTPGGPQALSFKPVINIHSNLIVCAEAT